MKSIILVMVITTLILSCNEDDKGCSIESLCKIEQPRLSNSVFQGNLSFCNTQPNQSTTQGIASVYLDANQGQLRLRSEPTGFIDTVFLVSYDCNSAPECLFSSGDFLNENGDKIASYEGGATPRIYIQSLVFSGCIINYSGGIQ